ncbi:MAG: SpoIIE family protein phosphatase [Acidobacteria bacterium]|nr:SpoIIE family protein phosphatase [Acidobacteriota bacterium]
MDETRHHGVNSKGVAPPLPISAEELRVRALNDTHVLDRGADFRFDRVTRLCRNLFKVPLAYVAFIDRDLPRVKSSSGELPDTPRRREDSFSNMAIQQTGLFLIEDAAADARYSSNPNVTGTPYLRFFAAYPIETQGQRVGALCLMDTEARHLSELEASLLRDLALWIQNEVQRDADHDRATAVHRALLPHALPSFDGYELVGRCIPALAVGGDYYDWYLSTDDELVVTLADVMGKGMGAAMIMATVRTVLRLIARETDLADALQRAARVMANDLARTNTFVTLFDARITKSTGDVEYVDAGLGLAFILHDNGSYDRLPVRGLPLGIDHETPWVAGHTQLKVDETLIVFSDGIYDSLGGTDEAFAIVAAHFVGRDSLDDCVRTLITGITDRPTSDDITILALRRTETT